MANGFKIKLDTILIDPERNFHGVVKSRLEELDDKGKTVRRYGVHTPTHDGGKTALYWYREGRVQLVDGTFAVVYPKRVDLLSGAVGASEMRASKSEPVERTIAYNDGTQRAA